MRDQRPILYLMVGLPGSGKTTLARQLEAEHRALRLTKDEWVKALFGDDNPAWASDVIEGRLVEIALRTLELGMNVVLDFGLWSRDERSSLRQAALDVGAVAEVRYLAVSPEEQRRRLDARLTSSPQKTWPITDGELTAWTAAFDVPTAGEIDGSEPIDPPPSGADSWQSWRSSRWRST